MNILVKRVPKWYKKGTGSYIQIAGKGILIIAYISVTNNDVDVRKIGKRFIETDMQHHITENTPLEQVVSYATQVLTGKKEVNYDLIYKL